MKRIFELIIKFFKWLFGCDSFKPYLDGDTLVDNGKVDDEKLIIKNAHIDGETTLHLSEQKKRRS